MNILEETTLQEKNEARDFMVADEKTKDLAIGATENFSKVTEADTAECIALRAHLLDILDEIQLHPELVSQQLDVFVEHINSHAHLVVGAYSNEDYAANSRQAIFVYDKDSNSTQLYETIAGNINGYQQELVDIRDNELPGLRKMWKAYLGSIWLPKDTTTLETVPTLLTEEEQHANETIAKLEDIKVAYNQATEDTRDKLEKSSV